MNATTETLETLEAMAVQIASCTAATDDLWVARALVRAAEAVRDVKAEAVQQHVVVFVRRRATGHDS